MWDYSRKLLDHFTNPRNVGSLDNPDGHSEVGSPDCGDAMQLDIRVDAGDLITEARFMTYGCASAIASASALTEMAVGLTLEEAEALENSSIVEYLGGMPEEKIHCSVMGADALRAAISDFRERRSRVRQVLEVLNEDPPESLAEALAGCRLSPESAGANEVGLICGPGADPQTTALEEWLSREVGHHVRVVVLG